MYPKTYVETTLHTAEFEGPQEVVDSLEVGADLRNFVDNVFNADNVWAESLFNDRVGRKRQSLSVKVSKTSLVDEFSNGLQSGITPGNVGFNKLEHGKGSLVQSNKDTIVNLAQSQQLEGFAALGGDTLKTTNTDHKGELGFGFNVKVAVFQGKQSFIFQGSFLLLVFLGVLFSSLQSQSSQLSSGLNINVKYILHIICYLDCLL